jgi:hypothetical protein
MKLCYCKQLSDIPSESYGTPKRPFVKKFPKKFKVRKKILIFGRTLFQTFLGPASPENEKKFFMKKFSLCGLRLFSPSRHFSAIYQLPASAIRFAWKLSVVWHDNINQRSPYYRVKKETSPILFTSESSNWLKLLWNACSATRKVSENYLLPDPAERRAFDLSLVCYYNIHHNCQFYTDN